MHKKMKEFHEWWFNEFYPMEILDTLIQELEAKEKELKTLIKSTLIFLRIPIPLESRFEANLGWRRFIRLERMLRQTRDNVEKNR